MVTCGQILLGRGREKKYLFTLKTLFSVFVLVIVLPVRAGQHRRVGGLELQTNEDIAKKSTRTKRFAQHETSLTSFLSVLLIFF